MTEPKTEVNQATKTIYIFISELLWAFEAADKIK